MNENNVQEIFVKLKFSPDTPVNKRQFAWRKINANKLWITNVKVDQEKGEVSFTSEFNINFSRKQIEKAIKNDTYFSTGEGLSLKIVEMELVELKEEAEIYGNE